MINLLLNENEKNTASEKSLMGVGRSDKTNENEVIHKGIKALEQLEKINNLNNDFIQKLLSNKLSDKAIIEQAKEFTKELALLMYYKI